MSWVKNATSLNSLRAETEKKVIKDCNHFGVYARSLHLTRNFLIQFTFQVEFLNINQYDIDMRSVKFNFIINRFCLQFVILFCCDMKATKKIVSKDMKNESLVFVNSWVKFLFDMQLFAFFCVTCWKFEIFFVK